LTIVLPIFFVACGFGFFVRKMTNGHWTALTVFIAIVIAYNFIKPPKPLVPSAPGTATIPAAQSGN